MLDELFPGDVAHGAGAYHRARAARMIAGDGLARDPLANLHALSRNIERFGNHHRKCRFVPLPLGVRNRIGGHLAVAIDLDFDFVFCKYPCARIFDHGRNAKPAQLAAFFRSGTALGIPFPVPELERFVEQSGKVRVVVRRSGGRLVRKRFGRNEIAPPQLGGIDASLGRSLAYRALDRVGDVGPPGAAISRNRRGIRQGKPPVSVEHRYAIDAGETGHRIADVAHGTRRRHVRAHIGDPLQAEREKAPFAI